MTQLTTKTDPYTTAIDWQMFVVEADGKAGISLRSLVNAGLYAHLHDAVSALKDSGFSFQAVTCKPSGTQGGRPAADYLMDLRTAQRFCARVQTPVGARILDLILDHHDEFQKLLAGDRSAHQQLAQAVAPAALSEDDRITAMLENMLASHKRQVALAAEQDRLARQQAQQYAEQQDALVALEDKVDALRVGAQGWTTCTQACAELGFRATGGGYHNAALLALAELNGVPVSHHAVEGRIVSNGPANVTEAHFSSGAMLQLRALVGQMRRMIGGSGRTTFRALTGRNYTVIL